MWKNVRSSILFKKKIEKQNIYLNGEKLEVVGVHSVLGTPIYTQVMEC